MNSECVAILYYNEEPCRVYGPFASEDEATDWLCSRNDYDAAVINDLRKPEKDSCQESACQHDHALALEDFDPITK